jgi:hypothetical protein
MHFQSPVENAVEKAAPKSPKPLLLLHFAFKFRPPLIFVTT